MPGRKDYDIDFIYDAQWYKNRAVELEKQVAELKASNSWRITASLRWLSACLKALRKQVILVPESALAREYCVGKGLEIGGAAHNPFGLNTVNIDNTGSMETIFKKKELKSCGKALKVDVVADGDSLPFHDGCQDFIVSSHVFEHLSNPIKALIEWDRVIKPGGIIFMIVPHKERTFDHISPRTTLEHLIEDYENNETINDCNYINGKKCHHHVFITEDLVQLVLYMVHEMRMKWELKAVRDIDDKVGNGFTIVIKKETA